MNTIFRLIRRIIRPEQLRELSLLLIIFLVLTIFSREIPRYYEWRTFYRISGSIVIITVVAVGQTLVVLTRNIDLSVGSIVGFTAFFIGRQVSQHENISIEVLILMAVGFGGLFGLVNGLLVAYGNIPSIVVTLGTMAIYRGIFVEYSNAKTITTQELPRWIVELPPKTIYTVKLPAWLDKLPRWFVNIVDGLEGFQVRNLVLATFVIVVFFQFVLGYFSFGRRLYAIGSSPENARLSGIPTRRIIVTAYILCGGLAGLGGYMHLARFGTVTVTAAQGLELQVVAAVVVGGVNIFGGSGTMIGVMLGAGLISLLEYSLNRIQLFDFRLPGPLKGVQIRIENTEFWQDALLGFFVLLAIASDALFLNRLRNLWARGELQLRDTVTPASEGTNHAEHA
jgi:rhamnose transport system permease protein